MKGTYKQIRQLFPATGYRAFCGSVSDDGTFSHEEIPVIGWAVVRHSLLADIGENVAHCVESLAPGSRDSVEIMVDQDGPSDISDANDYTYSNSFCVVVRPTEQLDTADLEKKTREHMVWAAKISARNHRIWELDEQHKSPDEIAKEIGERVETVRHVLTE